MIGIKIANLCSDNPLEWNDFTTHGVDGEDVDFKWFYRMVDPAPATFESMLGDKKKLPAPIADGPEPKGREDCIGTYLVLD